MEFSIDLTWFDLGWNICNQIYFPNLGSYQFQCELMIYSQIWIVWHENGLGVYSYYIQNFEEYG